MDEIYLGLLIAGAVVTGSFLYAAIVFTILTTIVGIAEWLG